VDAPLLSPALRQLLLAFAVVAAAALVAALVLLALLWRRLRRLRVEPGTGFWDTLRQVPLGLVVTLDLLDLALDVFAAPVVWFLLGRLNLRQLREVATVEALVPVTGVLPTMTICWLLARLGLRDEPARPRRGAGTLLEGEQVAPGKWRSRG
jgi:hypothetical protein